MSAARAVASFCRNAGPPVRGRVKAPLDRAVVYGPSAKRRGCGVPSRSSSRPSPGSTRTSPAEIAAAPSSYSAQQRAPGAFGRGVGQPRLDQRACLDVLPRYGSAARPEDPPPPVGLDRHVRAQETDDPGPGEREQLAQPGSRRAGGEIAEEAVPAAAGITEVAEADQLPVDGEQPEEDGEVRAVGRVVSPGQIRAYVVAQPVLERVVRVEAQPVQRPVEGGEIEPVGGVGYGRAHQGVQFGTAGVGGGVLLLEVGPVGAGALGVRGEEAVVVREAELLVDQRPDIAPEVGRLRPAQQCVDLLGPEEAGQRGPFTVQPVTDLGVVRDTAPRSDVQDRFASRGVVDQPPVVMAGAPRVASAAPFGDEHHQIDEGESEAADEDGFAGGQGGQITVRGEVGRQMDQSVLCREPAQLHVFRVRFGVEMSEGEHNEVGEERFGTVREPDALASAARTADAHGVRAVLVDGDTGRQGGDGLFVHPAQIGALHPAAGEGLAGEGGDLGTEPGLGRSERRLGRLRLGGEPRPALPDVPCPFVQRGSVPYRTGQGHRVIGEHGHVLGHGVHPEQRRLITAPDPPGPRRMRVHEMDVQRQTVVQGARVGGDPLQKACAARTCSDHDNRRGQGWSADGDRGHRGHRHAKAPWIQRSNTGVPSQKTQADRAPQHDPLVRREAKRCLRPVVKLVRTVNRPPRLG